jgi:hypothetical protein
MRHGAAGGHTGSLPGVASWISPKARKGEPSPIAGRGLFARAPISAHEVVAVKGGHVVDTAWATLSEYLVNSEIQIAEGLHLVALTDEEYDTVMLFVNHSCEPNLGFSGECGAGRDGRRRPRRGADGRLLPVRCRGRAYDLRLRDEELSRNRHGRGLAAARGPGPLRRLVQHLPGGSPEGQLVRKSTRGGG